jgi:TolA-binding protein
MPAKTQERVSRGGTLRLGIFAAGTLWLGAAALPAQVTPDQAADLVLNSARKAYNARSYDFAAARFREFLAKYGGHKKAPAARYGLALALLNGPAKDYATAAEQLQPLTGAANFPEHAFVLYYLGLAKRGLGVKELSLARPQDLPQRRAVANQRFDEAARQFEAAVKAFTARVKKPDPKARQLPVDLEWAARARCDQAEMLLRLLKAREAQDTAAPFLTDAVLVKSRYRHLGLYYHGLACFLRKDYPAAGQSLRRLAPFTNTAYALHARYVLARTYHLQGDLARAGEHYAGVLADYAKFKQQAARALKEPDKLKDDPEEKARLQALVKGPVPLHVAKAAFGSAELLYEKGRFADALARFTKFPKEYPGSGMLGDALLRQGFCQVKLGRFADAVKTLQAVADKEPRLADQALLWVGQAQAAAADPSKAQAYEQAMRTALDTFRRAADRAQQLAGADPEARVRRGEILLELAGTQQRLKQFREAAATYGTVLNDKLLPRREEEVLLHQAGALHRAGDFNASDQVCNRFRQTYPKSPLLPAALYHSAENAAAVFQAAEKNPNLPDRARALANLANEVAKRYQEVISKFPRCAHVNHAHYARAIIVYSQGDFTAARKDLLAIAPADRKGDLAPASYLLADCLLHLSAATGKDAPAADRGKSQLKTAAELLTTFSTAHPGAAQTPDALLKLGVCHERLAALGDTPKDRLRARTAARSALEKLIRDFPKHALVPQAVFERAKCLDRSGRKEAAVAELRRFRSDPLRATSVAPLALLELSRLLRDERDPREAARVLDECRKQHEAALLKDPQRSGWVIVLQYQHALALREAGEYPAAVQVLDGLIRQFPNRRETAEAALCRGQCLKEDAQGKLAAAQKKLAGGNRVPQELADARRASEEAYRALQAAVQYLADQANQLKQAHPAWEVRARLLYESAWGYRALAEVEVAEARARIQQDLLKKMLEEARKNPKQKPPAAPPEVPWSAVKHQPSEEKARAQYRALMEDTNLAALPLAARARLELAELLTQREEYQPALKLLQEAIDKKLHPGHTDRFRVHQGLVLAARKDIKAALAVFEAVAKDPASPEAGAAQYQAGECLMARKEYARAAERWTAFRDKKPFQNLPGWTDRALLRLGHAYEYLKDWDKSRQAYEVLLARFEKSPWANRARYGIGFSRQQQKEYARAVRHYRRAAADSSETAARSQFQIGMCRRAQQRSGDAVAAFLLVPLSYDFPEWSAAALCEAARTLAADGQPAQAEKLLRRVLRDYRQSPWAKVARTRLDALKKAGTD